MCLTYQNESRLKVAESEKPKDEHDETKLLRFKLRLNNCYLSMIRYELIGQLLWIFLTKRAGSNIFL